MCTDDFYEGKVCSLSHEPYIYDYIHVCYHGNITHVHVHTQLYSVFITRPFSMTLYITVITCIHLLQVHVHVHVHVYKLTLCVYH